MHRPIDHVAIAVASIDEVAPLFERLIGARASAPEQVERDGVRVAFIGTGPDRLELVEPTAATSAVARFLARRGTGLHHVAFRVPDLGAELDRLNALGVELIDRTPRAGAHGRRVAFIHPRSSGGVLVELVEG